MTKSEHDKGFAFGIAIAVRIIGVSQDRPSDAAEILDASGLTLEDFEASDLEEYDLAAIRACMPKEATK